MQRRQITLEDGRYLVFYTFDEMEATAEDAAAANSVAAGGAEDASTPAAETVAEPQATEEKGV